MNNLEILLVDDDEITNFLSKQILKSLNIANIRSANNGQAGIQAIEQQCPQVILLDIKMPVLDGFGFLEEKTSNNICPHSKVIMLSSSNSQEEIDRAQSFDSVIGYLEKPLKKDALQNLLSTL